MNKDCIAWAIQLTGEAGHAVVQMCDNRFASTGHTAISLSQCLYQIKPQIRFSVLDLLRVINGDSTIP